MKKGDILIIAIGLIIAAATFLFYQNIAATATQQTLIIKSDGKVIERILLTDTTNQILDFNTPLGNNKIEIKNGIVSATKASCPHQICVDSPHIHLAGQSIICLPNKLSVEIIGENDSEVDDIAY